MSSKSRKKRFTKPKKEEPVTAPTAPAPGPQPPRVVPQHDPAEDVPTLLHEAEGWFNQLKRSLAGFNTLRAALQTATGHVPEGERKKALPVFEFKASLVGAESREVVTCAVDLRKIDQQYVQHVLIPIINSMAGELLEACEEIGQRIDTIKPVLQAMVAPQS
jgi:hypothetical protein